jgi:dTDP-glucose 4,6-dehydratase
MTVLVTGGAGFVGSHLCEALVDAGRPVVCVDSFLTGSRDNVAHLLSSSLFTLVEQDITEGLDITEPLTAVAHLASPASPVDYLRLPVETLLVGSVGTRNALEVARKHGARFLMASTSEVYGDPLVHPQREDYWGNVNSVGPRAVYDEAKRFAEALTTAYRTAHRVDTTIARIFNTYGPRMRAHDGRVVPTFIRQALAGEALTVAGQGTQTRSLCHVSDTVAGLLALLGSDHAGPMNIGNSDEYTVLEIAETIQRLCGSSSPVAHIALPVDDPQRRCPDTELASRVLDWKPSVALDDGLAETISWFRRADRVSAR